MRQTGKFLFVGPYPAHYMRVFHQRLIRIFPGRTAFFYLRDEANVAERSYERGDLPPSGRTWTAGSTSFFDFLTAVRDFGPTVIIFNGLYPRHLLFVFICYRLFCRNRVKLWFWADHNLLTMLRESSLKRSARRLVHGFLLRRMDRLLYVGSKTRDFYLWITGDAAVIHKLWWLPYPHLPMAQISAVRPPERGTLKLLYVGRLVPDKGLDQLLRALAILDPVILGQIQLTVVGDGTEREFLVRLARQIYVDGCVKFLGAVPSDQAPSVFADADVFVLPAEREPWGLVVNEALDAGFPVIAPFWVGAVGDLVVDQVNGLVIRDNSPQALAAAIARLAGDREFLQLLKEGCRAVHPGRRWSVDGTVAQFVALTEIA